MVNIHCGNLGVVAIVNQAIAKYPPPQVPVFHQGPSADRIAGRACTRVENYLAEAVVPSDRATPPPPPPPPPQF